MPEGLKIWRGPEIINDHLMEQVLLLNLPKSRWAIAHPAHLFPGSLRRTELPFRILAAHYAS